MKKRKFNDGGIYTAEMGQPPMEPDDASATPSPVKRPMPARRPMPVKRPMPARRPAPSQAIPRGVPSEAPVMPGMKKGGSVGSASKRGDGIATKGKTKGAQIKMKSGGKC